MIISSRFVLSCFVLFLIFHIAFVFFGSYAYPWVDYLTHLSLGIISAILFFFLFDNFLGERNHYLAEKIKIVLMSISFASFVGIIWETHEFFFSNFFSTYIQRSVEGITYDLLFVLLGALIFSLPVIYKKN